MIADGAPSGSSDGARGVRAIMGPVAAAMVPGLCAQAALFGPGVLLNVVATGAAALVCESLVGPFTRGAVSASVPDLSALVTALILSASLPAGAAWWVGASAVAFALVFGKYVYGGLGQNPFNPAMAGFAFALLAFPGEMIRWQSGGWVDLWAGGGAGGSGLGPLIDGGRSAGAGVYDALTGATPLDAWHAGRLLAGTGGGEGDPTPVSDPGLWLVAFAYAAGGVALLWFRIIHWRLPFAMLVPFAALSISGAVLGLEGLKAVALHLSSTSVWLGAFFVITDPVTAPTSRPAQWLFGAVAGAGTYFIREFGGYADGVAFAVLFANAIGPALDRWLPGSREDGPGSPG